MCAAKKMSANGKMSAEKKQKNIMEIIHVGYRYYFFKKKGRNGAEVFTFRYQLLLRQLPFFNFFWDLFFDGRPPGQSEVKDLLNMVGLLNALLLTTCASVFSSVEFNQLLAADIIWQDLDTGYGKYWKSWYSVPPSNQFYFDVSMSLCMFFIGVIVVVWVFADMLGKTGAARDIEYWYAHPPLKLRASLYPVVSPPLPTQYFTHSSATISDNNHLSFTFKGLTSTISKTTGRRSTTKLWTSPNSNAFCFIQRLESSSIIGVA